jgi:hypothetical protein
MGFPWSNYSEGVLRDPLEGGGEITRPGYPEPWEAGSTMRA